MMMFIGAAEGMVNCASNDMRNVKSVKYAFEAETPTSAKRRVLEMRGDYREVFETLKLVRYKPERYLNHLRLKSRYLEPMRSQKAPYEKMVIEVLMQDPTDPATLVQVPLSASLSPLDTLPTPYRIAIVSCFQARSCTS
jgi:hypothetical protein